MSRLLTALKRLDETGGDRAERSSSAVTLRSLAPRPIADLEPIQPQPRPAESNFAEAVAASDSAPTEALDASPIIELPSTDAWPKAHEPSIEPPAVANDAASDAVTVPRRTRSGPGRRATDRCRVAPEYAALCEAILERVSKSRPMAILVVPAAASVDAGTVAAELSLAMAESLDLPVVAIDADLDRMAADSESAVATAGLADVLLDRVDWRSVLASARDERVKLLTAGRPVSGAESLAPATARLGPIVSEMKTRYRCLIVHGGVPTNPLTASLVQACDLVYLIVRVGLTQRRVARAAKRALQRGGAVVHGSILLAGP